MYFLKPWCCVNQALIPQRAKEKSYHPVSSLPSSPPVIWLGEHNERHPVFNQCATPQSLLPSLTPACSPGAASALPDLSCTPADKPDRPAHLLSQLHPKPNTTCSLSQQKCSSTPHTPGSLPPMWMLMTLAALSHIQEAFHIQTQHREIAHVSVYRQRGKRENDYGLRRIPRNSRWSCQAGRFGKQVEIWWYVLPAGWSKAVSSSTTLY